MKSLAKILPMLRFHWKSLFKQIGRMLIWITCTVLLVSISWVFVYKWINPPKTPLMLMNQREAKLSNKSSNISQTWVPYDEISDRLILAILVAEDPLFFFHNGLIFKNIIRGLNLYIEADGVATFGFSTISQQTAKNVFLYPSRTLLRKGLEAYFTLLVEWIWGKKRILEIYLNVIELGQGIYGVEAACQKYFNSSCKTVSYKHILLLATGLCNPLNYQIDNPSQNLLQKTMILKQNINKRKGIARIVLREIVSRKPKKESIPTTTSPLQ